MKNLAYGAITNTSRLHKTLWHGTCAEVPAFAPLRDKMVLESDAPADSLWSRLVQLP